MDLRAAFIWDDFTEPQTHSNIFILFLDLRPEKIRLVERFSYAVIGLLWQYYNGVRWF